MKKKILLSLTLFGLLISACGGDPKKSVEQPVSTPDSKEVIVSNNDSKEPAPNSATPFSSEIVSPSSNSSTQAKVDINVINESTTYCTITANDRSGVPGDDATFTVNMKENYIKKGVTAMTSRGLDVPLIED